MLFIILCLCVIICVLMYIVFHLYARTKTVREEDVRLGKQEAFEAIRQRRNSVHKVALEALQSIFQEPDPCTVVISVDYHGIPLSFIGCLGGGIGEEVLARVETFSKKEVLLVGNPVRFIMGNAFHEQIAMNHMGMQANSKFPDIIPRYSDAELRTLVDPKARTGLSRAAASADTMVGEALGRPVKPLPPLPRRSDETPAVDVTDAEMAALTVHEKPEDKKSTLIGHGPMHLGKSRHDKKN